MAQTGYTPILIYSSSTTTNAPAAGSLTNSTLGSELAINITDGKLFYKDNANNVQVIAWKTTPTTAGGTGLTSYTAGDLLYYATGTALSKLAIGTANTVLTSSGSAPQWSTNLNIGSLTATSISDSGNLTFTGTGNRIIGDFSNATFANRVAFQTSTANSATTVYAIPSGSSTTAGFFASTDSAVTNGSEIRALVTGTVASLTSSFRGTGTTLPLVFDVAGERMRIFTSGGVSIGDTTDPGAGNLRLGTGNLVIGTSGKGIDFSATPGTGTSELFADYEEGTWTPVDGSGASLTFSSATGYYTKYGRVVTVVFNVVYPSTANGNAARVGGLPFTAANTANNLSNGCFNINTSTQIAQPSILANATNFAVLITAAGTSATNANCSLATLSGGLTYFV